MDCVVHRVNLPEHLFFHLFLWWDQEWKHELHREDRQHFHPQIKEIENLQTKQGLASKPMMQASPASQKTEQVKQHIYIKRANDPSKSVPSSHPAEPSHPRGTFQRNKTKEPRQAKATDQRRPTKLSKPGKLNPSQTNKSVNKEAN